MGAAAANTEPMVAARFPPSGSEPGAGLVARVDLVDPVDLGQGAPGSFVSAS
jgi:hypothetical protein